MPKAALSSARPGLRLSPVSPAGSEIGPRLPETDGERKEKIRARNAGCGYGAKKKQVHVWDREQAAVQRISAAAAHGRKIAKPRRETRNSFPQ